MSYELCLNGDGQQFHQYQQNEQSPFIPTHWTQKDIRGLKSMPCLGRGTKMRSMESQLPPPPLITWCPTAIHTMYIQTIKNLHRFASTPKATYYHKNEWQYKH